VIPRSFSGAVPSVPVFSPGHFPGGSPSFPPFPLFFSGDLIVLLFSADPPSSSFQFLLSSSSPEMEACLFDPLTRCFFPFLAFVLFPVAGESFVQVLGRSDPSSRWAQSGPFFCQVNSKVMCLSIRVFLPAVFSRG